MKKIPKDYEQIGTVMSDADNEIDKDIEKRLKKEMVQAGYAGWKFYGYIWWDREIKKYACEVWCYGIHKTTVIAETLEEIKEQVRDTYGGY